MKSYLLHLIRNMPCQGNLEGRYIGRTESPLPMEAVSQLAEMKSRWKYPQAQCFYAAPSTRCVDTLKILYPQADPQVVLELAECDFGDWENKTAAQLRDQPGFLSWMESGGQSAPPNGESGLVFTHRVCSGFEMLVENLMAGGKTSAVLVASAGVISTLLTAYGVPRAQPYEWMCPPGHGYTLRITPGLWMRTQIAEVEGTVPAGEDRESPDHLVVDLAREAADRAYGKKPGSQ